MNILYTLNDKFVPQVGTCICSICENNKEASEIKFYIIGRGISKSNQDKLKAFVKKYNRTITIYEIGDIDSYFDFEFDSNGWNNIILARLLLDRFLPKNIDRILYLDGDTIVRGSLSELWNTDLDGKMLGMVCEPTLNKERIKILELEKYLYCNSGVILIDLKRWRDEEIGKKILLFSKENMEKLFAPDQDAINCVLKDDIYYLSPKYNYENTFYLYPYKFIKKLVYPVKYNASEEEYKEAFKNPIIIHYLGEDRPWRVGNKHKYKKDFEKYLHMTPWKNMEYEQGWTLYFIFFDLFNKLTKPVPALRHKIMIFLIPKITKIRKRKVQKEKNAK